MKDLVKVISGTVLDENIEVSLKELCVMFQVEPDTVMELIEEGIIEPRSGSISFLGRNWAKLPPDQANALRGRIGRVFNTGNWVNHLSVMDNILLPQHHHTRRSVRRLCDEAGLLAEQFGLPGLPLRRPGDLTAADLQRAACVRAFLGRPTLVLLEDLC